MNESKSTRGTNLAEVQVEYHGFTGQFQSLMLATINENGTPLVSYTPFVVDDDMQFYVYISGLAQHTANIQRHHQVSIMLIEDEKTARQIFGRKRLTFQCQATLLERGSRLWQVASNLYEAKFGKFYGMIKSFGDFQMFKLSPTKGQFVLGFGQAYEIGGDKLDILTHRRGE